MNLAKRGKLAFSPICLACLMIAPGTAFEAYGCFCGRRPKPCVEFGSTSAVFIGRAVSGRAHEVKTDENGKTGVYLRGLVHFAVEKVFSGIDGKKEIDIDPDTDSDCGYFWFAPGETYLVYADYEPGTGYSTSMCSRTQLLAHATEDLNYLQRLPPKGSGIRIFGNVYTEPAPYSRSSRPITKGLAGIKVTAKDSQGRVFDTLTDGDGNYRFKGLEPDAYTVAANLPEYYEARSIDLDRVVDRGCAGANFDAVIDGQVSGVVVDLDDRPVYRVTADLVAIDENGNPGYIRRLDYTDEQGRFNIKGVPPGRYWLGVGILNGLGEEFPYRSVWHPGVIDRAQTTIIELGRAEKLSDYTIRLPSALPSRNIR